MTGTEAVDRAGQEKNRALKRIEVLILAVVRTGPLHGYGIVQEISRRTGGVVNVRAGSLYRVLDRLLRRGFLELSDGPPSARRTKTPGRPARMRASSRTSSQSSVR